LVKAGLHRRQTTIQCRVPDAKLKASHGAHIRRLGNWGNLYDLPQNAVRAHPAALDIPASLGGRSPSATTSRSNERSEVFAAGADEAARQRLLTPAGEIRLASFVRYFVTRCLSVSLESSRVDDGFVGCGSKTEVSGPARHVCFTLRNRHRQPAAACPLRVKNGSVPGSRGTSVLPSENEPALRERAARGTGCGDGVTR
jgi:hypothetical protein